jgi:hypothetical protein
MRQYEAVVRVMEQNGGYATLAHLYEHVLDVPGCDWRTRTPFASIRRIVQVHTDLFFKVRPGLWALSTWKERLPAGMQPTKKQSAECEEFSHSYYQGLIIRLGNLKNFETHVSPQDRNRVFLGKDTLGDLASLSEMHAFTYSHLVSRARTIDVAWFNERRMPDALFEVEHSTDMKNSLVKFVELQDFRAQMFIVADECRSRQFQDVLSFQAFRPIRNHVQFLGYEELSDYYANLVRAKALDSKFRSAE